MANYSLDEWGTPVIGGAISAYGDVGINNILGGKYVFFNLNPRMVLSEIVYGTHPSVTINAIVNVLETASITDIRQIAAVSSIIETISLVESSVQVIVEQIKSEIMMMVEDVYRNAYIEIPLHVTTVGDTYSRGVLATVLETIALVEERTIEDIQIIKTEATLVGDTLATSIARILTEATRIRDIITNSFIPIITGMDEWGNPIIGLITPLGNIVYANISGGRDFAIRNTSWIELAEVISLVHNYSLLVDKILVETPVMVDIKISDVVKLLFDELMYAGDAYIPLVSAIKSEMSYVSDTIYQKSVVMYVLEIPIMVDTTIKQATSYASEILTMVDGYISYPIKYLRETIDTIESKTYTATHFMNEIIQAVEYRGIEFYFLEIPVVGDLISSTVFKILNEVSILVDTYYNTQFLYEIPILVDSHSELFWKNMGELFAVSDSYRNMFIKEENLVVVESILKDAVYHLFQQIDVWDRTVRKNPLHYISDIVHGTDAPITYRIIRPISEVISLADGTLLKMVESIKVDIIDVQEIRGNLTISKYISEVVSATDSLIGRSFAYLIEKAYIADTRMTNATTHILNKIKTLDTKYKHAYGYVSEIIEIADTKIVHPIINKLETLVYSESRQTKPQVTKIETTRYRDRIVKQPMVYVTNIISLFDSKYASYTKVLSEVFPLIESRYALLNHYILEKFSLSDVKIKHPQIYATEAIDILESKMLTFYRSDIIAISDSITRQFARYLSDRIKSIDRIQKSASKTISEMGTLGDVVFYENISRILTESTSVADEISYSVLRYLSERIRSIDSKLSRSMKYLSLENVFGSDTRFALPSKILAETLSAVDSYSRQVSAFCQERLRSIDVRNSRVVFAISDLLLVVDTTTTTIRKMLIETVLHLDTNIRGITKLLVENTRALQRFVKWPIHTQLESMNFSDEGVRIISKRVLEDALTVGDSLQRTLIAYVEEALLISDKKRKEYTSILEEHFHMGDALRSFKSLFRRHGSKASQTTRQSVTRQTTKTTTSVQDTHQAEIDEDAD